MKYEIMTKQQAIAIHETNGEPTMSSLRIAEVTGKEHKHVLRDIENILDEVDESTEKTLKSKFGFTYSATDKLGRTKKYKHYLLPEREFNLVVSGYSAKYRLQLIDELMSYRKNKPIVELTPFQLMEKANLLLIEENKKKDDMLKRNKKIIESLNVISEATRDNGTTMTIQEFCKIVTNVIDGTNLGRTSAYAILRSMNLVMSKSTQPTQSAMTRKLLNYVKHDYGYMTMVYNDRANDLIKLMVKHLQKNPNLNNALGHPLGDVV